MKCRLKLGMGLIWMSNFWIVYVLKCDLGRSWANISGSSVGWVENTRMSTQPICYLRNKNSINSMAGRKVGPWVQFFWLGIWKCYSLWVWKVNKQTLTHIRDITPGPTGASVVAPKFSDTLTLFHQRGWAAKGGGQILLHHCRDCTKNFLMVTSLHINLALDWAPKFAIPSLGFVLYWNLRQNWISQFSSSVYL